jgi:hypothetical protein
MAQGTIPVFLRPLSIVALDDELPVNISHEPGDLALFLLSELTQYHGVRRARVPRRWYE